MKTNFDYNFLIDLTPFGFPFGDSSESVDKCCRTMVPRDLRKTSQYYGTEGFEENIGLCRAMVPRDLRTLDNVVKCEVLNDFTLLNVKKYYLNVPIFRC